MSYTVELVSKLKMRRPTGFKKIFSSPYLTEYLEARNRGATFKELEELARKFNEEISYETFRRFFRALDKLEKIEGYRKPSIPKEEEEWVIMDKIAEQQKILMQLEDNLQLLKNIVNRILNEEESIKLLPDILREQRLTLEAIAKQREQMKDAPHVTREDLISFLIRLADYINPDILQEILRAVKNLKAGLIKRYLSEGEREYILREVLESEEETGS